MFECRLVIDKGIWYFVFIDEWDADNFYHAAKGDPSKQQYICSYSGYYNAVRMG